MLTNAKRSLVQEKCLGLEMVNLTPFCTILSYLILSYLHPGLSSPHLHCSILYLPCPREGPGLHKLLREQKSLCSTDFAAIIFQPVNVQWVGVKDSLSRFNLIPKSRDPTFQYCQMALNFYGWKNETLASQRFQPANQRSWVSLLVSSVLPVLTR